MDSSLFEFDSMEENKIISSDKKKQKSKKKVNKELAKLSDPLLEIEHNYTVSDNLPLYTETEIFPQSLDLKFATLQDMSDDDFSQYCEKLRHHFLDLRYKKNHPIFGGSRSLDDIITNLNHMKNYDIDIPSDGEALINTNDAGVVFGGKVFIKDDNEYMFNSGERFSKVINHWFPELYDTAVASAGKSVMDQFSSPDDFLNNMTAIVIKDRLKLKRDNPDITISQGLLSSLRVVNGNQVVGNFPSGIAKWIYINTFKQFPDVKEYNVLDQCMGWGGRMLGFLSSTSHPILKNKKINLFGTDVNNTTHPRFKKVVNFWRDVIYDKTDADFEVYKSTIPAEDLLKDDMFSNRKGKFHVALTSPPYFNKELYSEDENQSFRKHPSYAEWRDNFLKPVIQNTHELLCTGGYMWFNIADIKTTKKNHPSGYFPLEEDTIRFAEEQGFKYIRTYKMLLHLMVGLSRDKDDGIKATTKNVVEIKHSGKISKYEPIFLFKKM